MRRYRSSKLEITREGERSARWTFRQVVVVGTEFTYRVTDRNFTARNAWEFLVRIPRDNHDRIEVRPSRVPNLAAWAELDRRSIMLSRARRNKFRSQYYAKVTLADPTKGKTKVGVRSDQRDDLPGWFDSLAPRLRSKDDVAPTRGSDGRALVAVFRRDEHQQMVALFFASKVWVLSEHFQLKD